MVLIADKKNIAEKYSISSHVYIIQSLARNLMGCIFKYQHMGIPTKICRYAYAHGKPHLLGFFTYTKVAFKFTNIRLAGHPLEGLAQTQHLNLFKALF